MDLPPRIYLTPARVIGCLRPGQVDVVIRPGRYRGNDDPTGAYPIEAFPSELRRPNAEVWIVSDDDSMRVIDVCPRTDSEPPEKYRAALAESEERRRREIQAYQTRRAVENRSRKRWWRLWW